jgi:hypothetical protein
MIERAICLHNQSTARNIDGVKLTNASSRKRRLFGLTLRGMINIEIIFKKIVVEVRTRKYWHGIETYGLFSRK